MTTLLLDAEALYADLLVGVRKLMQPGSALVGIWSGGAWLAERLQRDLGLPGEPGVISSSMHRDDFGSKGMSASADWVLDGLADDATLTRYRMGSDLFHEFGAVNAPTSRFCELTVDDAWQGIYALRETDPVATVGSDA